MAITRRVTQVYAGPSSSGQILAPTIDVGLGVPAAMAAAVINGVFGGDSVSSTTVYQGYRVVQAMNLSARRYVVFGAAHNNMNRTALETFANGGIRIVFQDVFGNWASYHFFGSGFGNFGTGSEASFAAFLGFGTGADAGAFSPQWIIDRNRAGNQSNGVLDWSNIAAFEVHIRPRSSGRMELAVGRFSNAESPLHTGTVGTDGFLQDIANVYGAPGSGLYPILWAARRISPYASGTPQIIESYLMGFDVGDGATTTTLNVANRGHVLWSRPEEFSATNPVPNAVVLVQDPRLIRINQSASDSVTYTDCLFAAPSRWGVEVTGSTAGTCVFTRCQFWRYETFVANHAQFIDCQFSEAFAPVEVNGATVILDGVIRDATTTALKVNTGPAIYDDLRLRFNNPTAIADIELGSGGAGTYELPNITVPAGYTLKIRNNSATNAISVAIPTGITFSTSTAGGTITVTTPSVTLDGTITNIFPGSRLQVFNVTKNAEVFNGIIAGTTYTNTYVEGTTFASGDLVRIRLAYQNGTTAKEFVEAEALASGTGWSFRANQVDDPVYIANNIDGSLVTGITINDGIDRMIINIAGGSVSWPQIYAYNMFWLFTAAGIIDDGAIITAKDTANYIVTGFKIRNSSTVPLSITNGYGVDAATGSVASLIDQAGSVGNIYQTPDVVIAYATGSGLSPAESAKLMSLNTDAVNLVAIRGQTITGTGSESDPWGP